MRKPSLLYLMFILLVAAASPPLCRGQIPEGQILGTITDASGGVIPGVTIALEDELKGIRQTTVSSDSGVFTFSYLNSGTYRVVVEQAGFKKAVYPGIKVEVGEKRRVDVKLEVGDISATVEVTGAAALVSTDSAAVSSIVSTQEVIGMPLNGREFSQLAALMPGARITGSYGGALITYFAQAVTVGGTNSAKNSYSVDGVDNTFNIWNGPAMNPSVDAIQEFKIDKSQFAAEYGRGGAEIQLATKSGSNQFHGAAWEYLRNYALNAGNYTTHIQDSLKRNQYGANLGGPIFRNKAFFFFNWEGNRERDSVQPRGSVFTDKMRTGDLSEFLPSRVVKDPRTGQPFPGNIIPSSRLSPVAVAYLEAMMPHSNLPGVTSNLIRPFTTQRNWDQYITRVDYKLTAKDDLFGRLNAQPRSGIAAPLSATSINHEEQFKFYNSGAGWTRSWSPKFITEARFGYHHENLLLQSKKPDKLPSTYIQGFGSTQPPPDRLPVVSITDFDGYAMWGFPLGFIQNSYEYVANLTWFHGNHLIKAGATLRNQGMDKTRSPEYQVSLGFNGYATGVAAGDYLLGLPYSASESLGYVIRKQRYGDYSFYVQDDWKVSPRLTLNVGLRYELNTLPSEVSDLWGGFDYDSQKIALAGDHIVQSAIPDPFVYNSYKDFLITADKTKLPVHTLVFGDHNNFSPRFGFAWRPFADNKTVVRGGYGSFYLLEDGNTMFNQTGTIPYGGSVSTSAVVNPALTMLQPFGTIGSAPLPSTSGRYPNLRTPYLQQMTLGVQRELPWKMLAEVNVQDQNSLKLESSYSISQAPIGAGTVNDRRLYKQYSGVSMTFHDGHARYDSLEILVKKSSPSYTFQWSHTFAKNMIQSGPFIYAKDLFDGPGGYVPNLDKAHFLINLPFGRGRRWMSQGGVVDQILGGWTLSGIAILYQSGSPFTIGYSGDPANVGIFSVRAKRIGNGNIDNPTMSKWFDTSAFAAPDAGTFGNAGTGILFGPASRFFDAAIYKSFRIREGTKLQFRTEMFNAFNHPNLGSPNTTLNGFAFGQILTKSQTPRVIQFALRVEF